MAILMPDLTVEVYNADYRVLSRIPWQEAVRLILRGAVYVIDVHSPAVHIRSPSLVIELPVSVALHEYVHIPYKPDNRVTRDGVLRRDRNICCYCGGPADTVDHILPRSWRRGHLVQPGGGLPGLQRCQRRPDATGGWDAADPRTLRTQGARPGPVASGPAASLIPLRAGGARQHHLKGVCNRRPPARCRVNPRSVNR